MTTPQSPHSKPIDRWIPWMFVAFFVVIAMVDAVFVTFAIKTRPGTVTEQAYEKGLAYNATLDAAEKQKALGWTDVTTYEDGILSFTLKDKDGKPLSGAEVTAKITRPVAEGYDSTVTLAQTGEGVYTSAVALPLKGLWEIRIYSTWQKQPYQTFLPIELP